MEIKEKFLEAVKNVGYALGIEDKEFRADKEVVLEDMKKNGYFLKHLISEKLKNDKDVVLEAVKSRGLALEYAIKRLQNDKDVVLEAVKKVVKLCNLRAKDCKMIKTLFWKL